MNDFLAHFLLIDQYDLSTPNVIILIYHKVIKTKLAVFSFLLDLLKF